MTKNNTILYNLSVILLEDLLKQNLISEEEFYEGKNEFQNVYGIA